MCSTFRSWLTCIPHMFSVNRDTCLKTVWFCSNTCISLVVTVGYWCKCVYIFKFFIWLTRMCSSSWTCYWLDIVWLIFVFIWLTCMSSSSWTCYWLDIVWLIFVLHLLNYKDVYHVTHSLRLSASLIRSPRCTICKHIKGAILSCFHGLTLAQVVIV